MGPSLLIVVFSLDWLRNYPLWFISRLVDSNIHKHALASQDRGSDSHIGSRCVKWASLIKRKSKKRTIATTWCLTTSIGIRVTHCVIWGNRIWGLLGKVQRTEFQIPRQWGAPQVMPWSGEMAGGENIDCPLPSPVSTQMPLQEDEDSDALPWVQAHKSLPPAQPPSTPSICKCSTSASGRAARLCAAPSPPQ